MPAKTHLASIVYDGCFHRGAELDIGNSGASKTIDWGTANFQKITLTNATVTLTFTAPSDAEYPSLIATLVLRVVQDVSGNRNISWPASIKWPGGTVTAPTLTANAVDIFTFQYIGGLYYASYSKDLR